MRSHSRALPRRPPQVFTASPPFQLSHWGKGSFCTSLFFSSLMQKRRCPLPISRRALFPSMRRQFLSLLDQPTPTFPFSWEFPDREPVFLLKQPLLLSSTRFLPSSHIQPYRFSFFFSANLFIFLQGVAPGINLPAASRVVSFVVLLLLIFKSPLFLSSFSRKVVFITVVSPISAGFAFSSLTFGKIGRRPSSSLHPIELL